MRCMEGVTHLFEFPGEEKRGHPTKRTTSQPWRAAEAWSCCNGATRGVSEAF